MKSTKRMNKYLFYSMKKRPTRSLVTKVYDDDDDTVVSSSADLARVCNILYSKLCTKSTPCEQRRECCVELIRYVSSVILRMAQMGGRPRSRKRNSTIQFRHLQKERTQGQMDLRLISLKFIGVL